MTKCSELFKGYCSGINIRTLNFKFGQTQPIKVYSPRKLIFNVYSPPTFLVILRFGNRLRSSYIVQFGHLNNPPYNGWVWARRPNPDGRINKNQTAENKQPDGRTERLNLTIRPNID